jgi:hypothetical protein
MSIPVSVPFTKNEFVVHVMLTVVMAALVMVPVFAVATQFCETGAVGLCNTVTVYV